MAAPPVEASSQDPRADLPPVAELLADRVRGRLREPLVKTGEGFAVGLEALRRTWDIKSWFWEFLQQCWFLARICSPPVILISIPLGATIALQLADFASQLGAESFLGGGSVIGIVRQAAPIASAILMAGAGGAAMAADMGARNTREELDAMQVTAVNPIHRLVTPRLWAASIVSVLLVPLVIISATAGSFFFIVIGLGTTPGSFYDGATLLLEPADMYVTIGRAFVYGMIVGIVACYVGMNCARSPIGVGRAVNRATVVSILLVFLAHFVIEALYFAIHPPALIR